MIYADTKQGVETKRKAFIRKWRLKCPAVAASLVEAGDKLFTFTRFPKSQWKSIRTSNAIVSVACASAACSRALAQPRPLCGLARANAVGPAPAFGAEAVALAAFFGS